MGKRQEKESGTIVKPDTVYKQTYNAALDLLRGGRRNDVLPSENELRRTLGVSRTTVRKIVFRLIDQGYVRLDGAVRRIRAKPIAAAYFPSIETVSTGKQVERQFMEWMLRDDTKPGTMINELELARQFGVGTSAVREFLSHFRRFGLIEKRANAGWLFKGFTEDFAAELFEIRELFELRSVRAFAMLPSDDAGWAALETIRDDHVQLLAEIDERFHDFSNLDNRFHRLVNSASPNRFIDDFYDIITLIFHYHYQWNKRDERQRNEVAIGEHLAYIDALLRRDRRGAERACRRHLASAKQTLRRAFLQP
jgi:DNA-binding GntR family transcriptional regulator